MLYKCDHCNYYSKRLSNLVRHQNRLYPCNKTSKLKVCKSEEGRNVNDGSQNVNDGSQNVNDGSQNVNGLGQNVNGLGQNVNVVGQKINETNISVYGTTKNEIDNTILYKHKCKKCAKELSSKRRLNEHENKCSGLHPLQCVICLKMFKSAVGKSQHKKYVKCSPLH